ncbi:MAG: hypothetical protein DME40_10300 [Verrucomicrobia bacterium]|nr:MAG: hypothetical protein DME40_10300 [Verrucomicrobiota bacterium]PYM06080.1 MAG: hypothetical protein DMF15_14045 [Verrucomicrobiota bacterium]
MQSAIAAAAIETALSATKDRLPLEILRATRLPCTKTVVAGFVSNADRKEMASRTDAYNKPSIAHP